MFISRAIRNDASVRTSTHTSYIFYIRKQLASIINSSQKCIHIIRIHIARMDLQPPPIDQVYTSLEELSEAVNTHAADQGYAVIIKRSKKSKKKELRKVWSECDKSGQCKVRGLGIRQSSSRKDDCPFAIIASRNSELETWTIDIKCSEHNHPPTLAGAHPTHRRAAMTTDVKTQIVSQSQVDAPARQIFCLGMDEENPIYKTKDIYNQRAYQRRKELGPLSPVQALMQRLNKKKEWYMEYCADLDFRIRRLFFAKTSLHKVLKLNYEVLLMDCIYKTNVYRMPLCIITGVTLLNTTYYVSFAFLSIETVED